jgi:hypothetical protein
LDKNKIKLGGINHIIQIDESLSLRGHKALQIEKKTYTSIQTSSETTLYIDNLLNERYDVTDGNEANKPRGRGRPRKTVTTLLQKPHLKLHQLII